MMLIQKTLSHHIQVMSFGLDTLSAKYTDLEEWKPLRRLGQRHFCVRVHAPYVCICIEKNLTYNIMHKKGAVEMYNRDLKELRKLEKERRERHKCSLPNPRFRVMCLYNL